MLVLFQTLTAGILISLSFTGISCRGVWDVAVFTKPHERKHQSGAKNNAEMSLEILNSHNSENKAGDEPAMFAYVLRSEFVVRAKSKGFKLVGYKDKDIFVRKDGAAASEVNLAGLLYEFEVLEVLCSGGHFREESVKRPDIGKNFQIFKKEDGSLSEGYVAESEYLMFVERFPDEERSLELYDLDKDIPYFQILDLAEPVFYEHRHNPPAHRKGIFYFNWPSHRFRIQRIESFCRAFCLDNPESQKEKLKALLMSPDAELRENAKYAIKWIKSRQKH
jgi:hypothetical protein